MSESTTLLTIEVPATVDERLAEVAQVTSRPKSRVAQEALVYFLDLYDWQTQAIREGIADADAGRLVDHEEVATWLESWGTDSELPAPRCD